MKRLGLFLLPLICLGCENNSSKRAIAHLSPTEGNEVYGTVIFTTKDDGVHIVADFEGLAPGKHGFHIHEHGDCSSGDGSSAGGHYNPTNAPHGGPGDSDRHVGDLGNVMADDEGRAHHEAVDKVISLDGSYSIIGKSVVIHAGEDDLVSQPSGNSGPRVACGEIVEE